MCVGGGGGGGGASHLGSSAYDYNNETMAYFCSANNTNDYADEGPYTSIHSCNEMNLHDDVSLASCRLITPVAIIKFYLSRLQWKKKYTWFLQRVKKHSIHK